MIDKISDNYLARLNESQLRSRYERVDRSRITTLIDDGELRRATIIIPEAVISELEAQAANYVNTLITLGLFSIFLGIRALSTKKGLMEP